MKVLLKGGQVFCSGNFLHRDILLEDGIVVSIEPELPRIAGDLVFFLPKYHLVPGFADVHVHLREPGYGYKETIETGTQAAAQGGFTLVCAMPNLNPAPDSLEHLWQELDLIKTTAKVQVLPYGCITKGRAGKELVDMQAMAPFVAGFSDDGSGVQSDEVMRSAMLEAKAAGKLIAAHCEDETLLHGGVMHDGMFAQKTGHPGICSQSEWGKIERDLRLVTQIGVRYHVCHVSTKESVALLREAKKRGLPVTAEVAPHYLVMCDEDLTDEGRFKMNPPIRAKEDREALLEGFLDGTLDVIATDHAPHAAEEKRGGFAKSAMGVVGLETAFPVLYAKLVCEQKVLTLEALVQRMSETPRHIFGAPQNAIKVGGRLDATVLDLASSYTIDPANFSTMGRSTPFEGWKVQGRSVMTWAGGALAFVAQEVKREETERAD